ncbi:hypothetical protein JW992_02500 [candidate division KSB1 bacterium]|nr:hypothetical protein [candidate division KSB1 bacterium]
MRSKLQRHCPIVFHQITRILRRLCCRDSPSYTNFCQIILQEFFCLHKLMQRLSIGLSKEPVPSSIDRLFSCHVWCI